MAKGEQVQFVINSGELLVINQTPIILGKQIIINVVPQSDPYSPPHNNTIYNMYAYFKQTCINIDIKFVFNKLIIIKTIMYYVFSNTL